MTVKGVFVSATRKDGISRDEKGFFRLGGISFGFEGEGEKREGGGVEEGGKLCCRHVVDQDRFII